MAERILQILQAGELFVDRSDNLIGVAALFGVFQEAGVKKWLFVLAGQTFRLRDWGDVSDQELQGNSSVNKRLKHQFGGGLRVGEWDKRVFNYNPGSNGKVDQRFHQSAAWPRDSRLWNKWPMRWNQGRSIKNKPVFARLKLRTQLLPCRRWWGQLRGKATHQQLSLRSQ